MIILAVYYTLADIVLILQCFWYKGFTLRDEVKGEGDESDDDEILPSERLPLLSDGRRSGNANALHVHGNSNGQEAQQPRISDVERRQSTHSQGSFRERYLSIDGTHLSPVTPLLDDPISVHSHANVIPKSQAPPPSTLQATLFNLGTILLVCAAGVFGWYLSVRRASPPSDTPPGWQDPSSDSPLSFNLWGQIFGYICAALYLGSRIPQLLLNYRRKSTEGISMLFFLFACLGNLTYVLSIVVYQPICKGRVCRDGEARAIYWKYIAVNFSWLLGSFGTLLLDAGVFVQYFLYRNEDEETSDEESIDEED